jgi:RNase P/RNase MRP subunit p30
LCIVSDRPGEVNPVSQINFFMQLFTKHRFSVIIAPDAAERWEVKLPLWVFVFLAIKLKMS